jgi:DNA-binding response OmpR family regulator
MLEFGNILDEIKNDKRDLILLDINLPYFDGYYIAER